MCWEAGKGGGHFVGVSFLGGRGLEGGLVGWWGVDGGQDSKGEVGRFAARIARGKCCVQVHYSHMTVETYRRVKAASKYALRTDVEW